MIAVLPTPSAPIGCRGSHLEHSSPRLVSSRRRLAIGTLGTLLPYCHALLSDIATHSHISCIFWCCHYPLTINLSWQRSTLPKHASEPLAGRRFRQLRSFETAAMPARLPKSSATRRSPFALVAQNEACDASISLPNVRVGNTNLDQVIPRRSPKQARPLLQTQIF